MKVITLLGNLTLIEIKKLYILILAPKSPVKSQERTEGGVITYGIGNNKKTIMYFLKDCDKSPRIGDNVKFNICQVKRADDFLNFDSSFKIIGYKFKTLSET